ncbi:MAG: uroporphyrinogen decarboxylase family protein [Thermoguttaceae bacterium]
MSGKSMMTGKDRFLTAVRREQPDRVPLFDFLFQQPLYEALIGRRPEHYNARDAVDCARALGHDAIWMPFGGYNGFQPEFLDANTYVDEWGTTYRHNGTSWPIDSPIDYPIKTRKDFARYRPPDPTLPGRSSELETFWQTSHNEMALTGGITGPFTTCWLLMGYEQICYALYDDPALLTDVFRLSNDYNKEAARRCVAAGCHALWLADDLGDSSRGFLKLDHFHRYYLPYLTELAEYVDGLGVPVLLHCCGRFSDYLPDLAETKIAAIHPVQRTAGMDLRWVKQRYGRRFCIIGNVDSSRTLPFGTPEQVEAEAREAIDIAAPGGGYVLASDHSLHDGIPVENIRALFQVGRDYGGDFYHRS